MKQALKGAIAFAMVGGVAQAGGLDRSGQGVNILFEEGDYLQVTFITTSPRVDGTSAVGNSYDVVETYSTPSFSYKHEITDKIDVALIYDRPYGAHVRYTNGPFVPGFAEINSRSLLGLVQYEFDNGFSLHGGLRGVKTEGEILSSPRPSFATGFLEGKTQFDWSGVVGLAYEKPEIALRVALTYWSSFDNGFDATYAPLTGLTPEGLPQFGPASAQSFDVEFPESINLDFQTGIAPKTLLFGSVKWVGWEGFNLTTPQGTWVDFTDDIFTYSLGVGREITDKLSLAVSLGYETEAAKPTTSLLSPTTGYQSLTVGGTYALSEHLNFSAGLTYAQLGDQYFEIPASGGQRVDFTDNDLWAVGVRVGVRF
ncbi:OmpP1/FadL family transporter [Shimia marina]|uniref:Outer membrane protein transport protein (OMPP1/FadL/TodX) n=1 Tax=Shimia marina TaxID=321267 RepID=A0A0P1FEH3_9RHOB|nr:outer membrane protein transport protein [Shimia marina]CUH53382.1 Outer membrane protein transport protein (OMPP1/FadL/TodX) [Shimia marina]SFD78297.1 Long-chain fatty acid transport protein [Shimia marina]